MLLTEVHAGISRPTCIKWRDWLSVDPSYIMQIYLAPSYFVDIFDILKQGELCTVAGIARMHHHSIAIVYIDQDS